MTLWITLKYLTVLWRFFLLYPYLSNSHVMSKNSQFQVSLPPTAMSIFFNDPRGYQPKGLQEPLFPCLCFASFLALLFPRASWRRGWEVYEHGGSTTLPNVHDSWRKPRFMISHEMPRASLTKLLSALSDAFISVLSMLPGFHGCHTQNKY